MRIITVSGSRSGAGKTTIVERLLKTLRSWSALKVTVVKNGPCPRDYSCGICDEQDAPFTIIEDLRIINQKGKDTQRMKRAGAKKVVWLRAKEDGLEEGLKHSLKRFKGCGGIIIEGTSVLRFLKPDLSIFIWV